MESISNAEWQVAKVLWQSAPLTAAEIIEKLKGNTDWNPKTIHTLIGRLSKKGIIKAQEGITPYSYYPLISEAECGIVKTQSLVNRIYNGSFSLMVSHFLKDEKLPPEEIEKLKKLINGQ